MIWELRLESERGKNASELFETTDDHPFWVNGAGWKRTDELAPGMTIATDDGDLMTVTSVAETGQTAPTFNIEVADFHSYFVGQSQVLVHNVCGPSEATVNKVRAQMQEHGTKSLEKAKASLQGRVAEHKVKIQEAQQSGGYTSSMEREVQAFENELQAIDQVIKEAK